jgi:hypothetical protein
MQGRTPPPVVPILFIAPRAGDPSLAIDTAFFTRYPDRRKYIRRYIPGETVEPMHPDTRVWVLLVGAERVRGFVPPAVNRVN